MRKFWKAILLFTALSLAAVGGYAARTEYFVHTTTTTAVIGTVDIDAGAIDGTAIGGTTPAAGAFTTITGDSLDDTVIGGVTPLAGTFTTATADDVVAKGPYVDVRAYASVNAAVADIGAAEKTLLIFGNQALTAALTVPATLHLEFLRGGKITLGAYNLAINGPMNRDPLSQRFDDSGAGSVSFGAGYVKDIHPEWWGNNTTPGTTDMLEELTSAVAAMANRQTLKLADVYLTSASVPVSNKDDITIDGYGAELRFPLTTAANDWLLDIVDSTDIRVLGLRLNGQTSSIVGYKTSAIYIADSQRITVRDCDFGDSGYGVFTQVLSGTIDDIHVDNCTQIGVNDYSAEDAANSVLSGVFVYHEDLATRCSVRNSYGRRVNSFVQASDGPELQVTNNWAIDTHDSAIYIRGPRQMVRGNFVIDAGKDAIKAADTSTSDKSIFTDNYIKGSGVHKADGGSMMFVHENSIVSNNIFVFDDPANRASPGQSGMAVYGSNTVVTGNVFQGWNVSDTQVAGVSVYPDRANVRGVVVSNNTFTNLYRAMKATGDDVYDLESVKFTGNVLYNCPTGFYLYNDQDQDSVKVELSYNIFDTYTGYAVYVSVSDSFRAIGNRFANGDAATGKAVFLHNSVDVVFRDNVSDGADNTFLTESGTTTYQVRRNNWDGATEGLTASEAKDWPLISVGGMAYEYVTVAGSTLGDYAVASMSVDTTGMTLTADVTASDTITVTLANSTTAPIDLASGTLYVKVIKK